MLVPEPSATAVPLNLNAKAYASEAESNARYATNFGPKAGAKMFDRREVDRDSCSVGALIAFEHGLELPCHIENIAERGAKLRIDPALQLPPYFTLRIPVLDGLYEDREVQFRWRIEGAVGVRFISRIDAEREKSITFVDHQSTGLKTAAYAAF